MLKDLRRLKESQKVFLPDGSVQVIEFAGSVQVLPQLLLHRVLLAPCFTHNLISVSQLAKDLHIKCIFLRTHCLIQRASNDSVLGMAKISGKLYVLEVDNVDIVNGVTSTEKLTAMEYNHKLGHVSLTRCCIFHTSSICTHKI